MQLNLSFTIASSHCIRLRVRLQRAVGYNEQLSSHQNRVYSYAWATGCKLRGQLCNSQMSNVFIQRNSHVFMLIFTLVTWHLTDKRLIAFLLVSFPPTGLLVMILIILLITVNVTVGGPSSQCKSPSATCVKSFCDTKSFILDLGLRDRSRLGFGVLTVKYN